jgi:hypothetical protein
MTEADFFAYLDFLSSYIKEASQGDLNLHRVPYLKDSLLEL